MTTPNDADRDFGSSDANFVCSQMQEVRCDIASIDEQPVSVHRRPSVSVFGITLGFTEPKGKR